MLGLTIWLLNQRIWCKSVLLEDWGHKLKFFVTKLGSCNWFEAWGRKVMCKVSLAHPIAGKKAAMKDYWGCAKGKGVNMKGFHQSKDRTLSTSKRNNEWKAKILTFVILKITWKGFPWSKDRTLWTSKMKAKILKFIKVII